MKRRVARLLTHAARLSASAALLLAAAAAAPAQTNAAANEQLWEATRKGDTAGVRAALKAGADANAKWRYDQTPLFKAAERGDSEIVRALLEAGANPNHRDTFYGATPLTWALDKNHVEAVRALIERGATGREDVLLAGARGGNSEYVKIALSKGELPAPLLTRALTLSGIRHRAEKDEAVRVKRAEIVEMLKSAGAQPPLQLDAATLKSYEGSYKTEAGQELKLAVNADGHLTVTTPGGTFVVVPSDKVTFSPIDFDGIQITFNVEGERATGFNFKQGQAPPQVYKRVETK
jgi:Ankyrin repeats (3 copies)